MPCRKGTHRRRGQAGGAAGVAGWARVAPATLLQAAAARPSHAQALCTAPSTRHGACKHSPRDACNATAHPGCANTPAHLLVKRARQRLVVVQPRAAAPRLLIGVRKRAQRPARARQPTKRNVRVTAHSQRRADDRASLQRSACSRQRSCAMPHCPVCRNLTSCVGAWLCMAQSAMQDDERRTRQQQRLVVSRSGGCCRRRAARGRCCVHVAAMPPHVLTCTGRDPQQPTTTTVRLVSPARTRAAHLEAVQVKLLGVRR